VVLALTATTARRVAVGRAPPGSGGPAGADGTGVAITPAVVWKLVDALQDGVALADDHGTIALANTRLAAMFGYQHAGLVGQPVELLVPVGLQEAHRGHRASYASAPTARPMGAGAPLVGLRKDGTTFPAEVSLSPVRAAAGHFTLAVIRDITKTRRLEDLARAAAAEHEHRNRELLDTIITTLFHAGLSLQAAVGLPAPASRQRISDALGHLDDIISQIRDTAAFTGTSHQAPPK
jgi:PAS domain S-box-containing protein